LTAATFGRTTILDFQVKVRYGMVARKGAGLRGFAVRDIVIIWDDEDDPDGNYWHICVEGHGLTREEVEDVLRDPESDIEVSRSSGRPTAFGWTASGLRIAVVFEEMSEDPTLVYPVSAYPVPPRRTRKRGSR
jgi:hypothetical protein